MDSGYLKILIGILLATFHINLGAVQILPPVLGWFVVTLGASDLLEKFPNTPFKNASLLSKAILSYTLITDAVAFFNPSLFSASSMFRFAPVIYAIIHLVFVYHILEGSILYVRSLNREDLEKSLVARTGTFIVLYLVNSLVLCYSLAFYGSVFLNITAAAGVILNLWLMLMMNEMRKLEAVPTPPDSIQNFTDAMESNENREE